MTYTWVLDPTAMSDYPGVSLDPDWCARIYRGPELPAGLADVAARPHSWERYVQDTINNTPPRTPRRSAALELRPYQAAQSERIQAAYGAGAPGYLLNFPTGSGKTPISIHAADAIRDAGSVLVITKLTTIPAWRAAIERFGSHKHRWVVLNPERLWKVFSHPRKRMAQIPGNLRLQAAADQGISRIAWDIVIVDEAQMLARSESLRNQIVERLERQFCILATATPFSEPDETYYVKDLLAYAAGIDPPGPDDDYSEWLRRLGLRLSNDSTGRWRHDANISDVSRLTSLLYDRGVGVAAAAADLDLPTQDRRLMPIELAPAEHAEYDKAWLEFLADNDLSLKNMVEPSMGMTIALRNLQKASLLKAPYVAEIVADYVADGYQVAVPAFFLNTVHELARHIAAALRKRRLPDRVVEMTGEDVAGLSGGHDRRERKRQAFQLGAALVAVYNAYEGINLHAGEHNVDGKGHDATATPRVSVMADVLAGGKRLLQAEGRTQRDGQHSPAVYPYAVDTAEQVWLSKVFAACANTRALSRGNTDAEHLTGLANQLHRDDDLPEH